MCYVIGTDEAGYGPNLGPLVISATVWRLPGRKSDCDLYERLAAFITHCPKTAADPECQRLLLADSKVLYKAGQGIRALERGVLALLACIGHRPVEWSEIWDLLAPGSDQHRRLEPWYAGYRGRLPLEADSGDLEAIAAIIAKGLKSCRSHLHAVRSRAVFPGQFNERTLQYGTKGAALSEMTLELLAETIGLLALDDEPIYVICDKHGGRNRYGALLQRHFPEWLVEVRREGAEESIYRWGPKNRRIEVRFRCRAEALLPAAVASMTSKYLRELAMRAFNHFWRQQIPDLRPTAGYPGDSTRFKNDIALTQASLGVEDRILWRDR